MNDTTTQAPVNALESFTDAILIGAYRRMRDEQMKVLAEQFQQATAPIVAKMEAIESEMQRRLLQRSGGSTKSHSTTENGTAYLKEKMSATCIDREAFLTYCVENFDDWGKKLLTAAVAKETLELFIESTKTDDTPNGTLPPGIKVEFIIKCNIRK